MTNFRFVFAFLFCVCFAMSVHYAVADDDSAWDKVKKLPTFVESEKVNPDALKKWINDVGFKAEFRKDKDKDKSDKSKDLYVRIGDTFVWIFYDEIFISYFAMWDVNKKSSENRRFRFANQCNNKVAFGKIAIKDQLICLEYTIDIASGVSPRQAIRTLLLFFLDCKDVVKLAKDEDLLDEDEEQ